MDINRFFELYNKYSWELDSKPEDVWEKQPYQVVFLENDAFIVTSTIFENTTLINALVSEKKGYGSQLLKNLKGSLMVFTKTAGKFYEKNGFTYIGQIYNRNDEPLEAYVKND